MASRPEIGAAPTLDTLARLRPWILERQRDMEIQDFFWPGLLDGGWRGLTDRYAPLLYGYRGRLGADQMVVHSPFATWDRHNLDSWPGARADMIARTVETLAPLIRRVGDQGVTLVIENIQDIDPADRVRLAQACASDRVRVSLDTGHAHCACGATGAPPVDYFMNVAGDMLEHVHVQDADGHAVRHWPPGEGDARWRCVFDAQARLGSKPRLLLELNDENRIEEAAACLTAQGLSA